MAISLDNTSRNVASSASSNSYNHTVGSGSDRILFFELVWVKTSGVPGVTVSSVTVDGNAASLVDYVTYVDACGGFSNGWVAGNGLYYYIAPAIGAVTIAATISGAVDALVLSGNSYFGAKQSSPINAFTSSSVPGGQDPFVIGVTPSVPNCWAIASIEDHVSPAVVVNSGGVFRNPGTGGDGLFDSDGTIANGVQHDFNIGPGGGVGFTPAWSGVMCAFEPAVAAGRRFFLV